MTTKEAPMQSAFKFHKLFVEGFAMNYCRVIALSSIPVTQTSHTKRIWTIKKEIEDGILYHYSPFINIFFLKQLMVFLYSFFYILYIKIFFRHSIYVVIDVLNSSLSTAAICACKIARIKTIGIVTDLPQMIIQQGKRKKKTLIKSLGNVLHRLTIYCYDGYVLLTAEMNKKINHQKKPYEIIEGLVDIRMKNSNNGMKDSNPREIIYSGGLYEKYGIKLLIEAFMKLDQKDIQLSIYGNGDFISEIPTYSTKDERIKYFGVVPNEKMVLAQLEATLLVNPRPSAEEFTKYSFPSKNLEYMASGTPMVSTRLPGMPKEYYDYIFTFEDETVEGFAKTFNQILSLPKDVLIEKGRIGKEFVMQKKNNKIQAEKVLKLFQQI